jgi:uncharacterized membrane protein
MSQPGPAEWSSMSFIALVLAIVAVGFAVTGRRRSNDRHLEPMLRELTKRVAALEAGMAQRPVAAEASTGPIAEPERSAAVTSPPPPAEPPTPPLAPPPVSSTPKKRFADFEEQLVRRWIVWLGALALAFGVVFLVKYSIERGFFGPTARVAGGVVLSLALLLVGEWTRRHPPALPEGIVQPDQVPPGLSAAGIVGLFASLLAGYALYALFPPLLAFALLAGVSAAAALLSLMYGRLMALLSFVGAYVVPGLVATPNPTAAGLLVYVMLVTVGALALLRWQGWGWLGWSVTAGAMAWAALSFLTSNHDWALGLYLVAIPAAFVLLFPADRSAPSRPAFVWTAAAIDAALMLILVVSSGYADLTITFASALALTLAAIGLYDLGYDRMAWIGGGLAFAVFAAWDFGPWQSNGPLSSYVVVAPSALLRPYLLLAMAAAIVFGGGGFLVMRRAPRPARWAFLSATMPIATLVAVYWRATEYGQSLPWGAVALALAAINALAVERLMKRPPLDGHATCVAAYALSTVAAVTLGMTMSLRLGWLSVALSLQLPALAWLCEQMGVKALRKAAMVLAAAVLVRLVLNPSVANYEIGANAIFNLLLYTYGVPCLAFFAATRWFRRGGEDGLVRLLEAGTVALFVALVSLQIRHALNGTLVARDYGLLEQGLQSSAWLAISYALLPRAPGQVHPVYDAAWRILAGAAAFNIVFVSCLLRNPLLIWEPVGPSPFFNALLFAYLVPGVLAALFYGRFRRLGRDLAANIAGWSALVLGFLYLSLEVRHFFNGEVLGYGSPSTAEWYVYSAVWLLYGLILVVAGLTFAQPAVRLAGFAVGAVVAVKVFLFDMSTLSGIYRAASFLGLGASLIGLGFLHQHMARAAALRGGVGTSAQ